MTNPGITIGRYRWTPRRTRKATWQMTVTKLVLAPIVGGALTLALIGWGQPDMLHPVGADGVPIVTVHTNR